MGIDRRYYLRMDDLAIAIDTAFDTRGPSRIAALRERILATLNRRLLRTGDTSIGGNLLLSAATQADEAMRHGALPRMADARRDIAEARATLAGEALE